ncbi:hypothetical protein GALMADRAFT_900101 [Galerina marginata CBS 339.88]|uniref:Uncharacterized protein n=1 Tax=Galerina marginata (strain CBS 339.88) TaxID=685588 RepID=A0A067SGD8_GALM3|nr:hypothetical protein GALMADRAFT_900101 [Galerina marginata CBS 339.88]
MEIFDEAQGASEPGAMWDEAEGSEDMDTDEDGDADTDTSPPTAAAAAASASAPTATTSTGVPQTIRQPAKIKRKGKERKKEKEKEKESQSQSQQRKAAELFAHTWDIQLGAPSVSSGVYLVFEGERVGVVTTNAVYVVTPSIPAEPPLLPRGSTRSLRKAKLKRLDHPDAATTSASHDDSDANHKFKQNRPSLQITRLPYFSNPSWLNEVSCLIMSDTGLYLNWNPTWPEPRGIIAVEDEDEDEGEEVELEEDEGREMREERRGRRLGTEVQAGEVNAEAEEYVSEKERVLQEWDREYEDGLEAYERLEGDRYHRASFISYFFSISKRID